MVFKRTMTCNKPRQYIFDLHQTEFPYLEIYILTLTNKKNKSRGFRNLIHVITISTFFPLLHSPSGCTINNFNNINNFINHLTNNFTPQQLLQQQQFKQLSYTTTCAL